MPCTEIDNAFAWAKQKSPVAAYFTKHTGVLTDPNNPGRDYCWYGFGDVSLNGAGHLAGDLKLYANVGKNPADAMEKWTGVTVRVEIFQDGTVTYQQKINGQPVGGLPPYQVKASCVAGVLLTGTFQNDVITVGLCPYPPPQIAK